MTSLSPSQSVGEDNESVTIDGVGQQDLAIALCG